MKKAKKRFFFYLKYLLFSKIRGYPPPPPNRKSFCAKALGRIGEYPQILLRKIQLKNRYFRFENSIFCHFFMHCQPFLVYYMAFLVHFQPQGLSIYYVIQDGEGRGAPDLLQYYIGVVSPIYYHITQGGVLNFITILQF